MKSFQSVLLCLFISLTYACSHPIEIRGKGTGDVVSASGDRDCSYEAYQANATACSVNAVAREYDETYTAEPRAGSQFRRWANACANADSNTCSFYVPANVVTSHWGETVPPLQAVFRPTTNTGFVSVLMGNGAFDPLAAGLDAHASANGFVDSSTTRFQADGDQGAPQAFWDDPAARDAIQAVLEVGDVDLLGMIYSGVYPEIDGYKTWIKYALGRNPDTRIFIAVPSAANADVYTAAQYEANFDVTHAAAHALVDDLRNVFPNVDIYCVPTGESAVELYKLYEDVALPDVSAIIGPAETSLFSDFEGNPGDILVEMGQLLWLRSIYGVDLAGYVYAPPYVTDLKALAQVTADAHESDYNAPPEVYPDANGDGIPDQFDHVELMNFLPAATRGVYQVYPQKPGALLGNVSTAPWGAGPLQVLQQYASGMDLAGNARRIVLAQMENNLESFVVAVDLGGSDFPALSSGLSLTAVAPYQGYSRWDIAGSSLQLAYNGVETMLIAPQSILEQALDVFEGLASNITAGPLSPQLGALQSNLPNSFLYGLPALYGTVTSAGNGDASLGQTELLSGSFGFNTANKLKGGIKFIGSNASSYVQRFTEILAGYDAPQIYSQGNTARVDLGGMLPDEDMRPLLKSLVLDMDAVDYTDAVVHGGNFPLLNFTVGESPNSMFINFEFKGAAERAAFEAAHLPEGFTLAQLPVLETDSPKYFLVLNMYGSSGGLVSGARAEWSVFINDPDNPGVPRYLVIEAKAFTLSADSVNLVTPAEPVFHELTATTIQSDVGVGPDDPTTYFSSTLQWPQDPENLVPLAREFAVANDFIFWGNAVADRILYNATAHAYDAIVLDPADVSIVDNSDWKDFIHPEPVHTLIYQTGIDYVISPWANLDATYLDLTPAWLDTLIGFKNSFYPSNVQDTAAAALRGEALALNSIDLATDVPTARYHFDLLNPVGLLTDVAGPGVYTPMQVELFDGDGPGSYLTLSVYQRENDPCGIRAEFSTYVVGPDGNPNTLRLDSFSSDACLNPVSLMTLAADISQDISSDILSTNISSSTVSFGATVDLSSSPGSLAGTSWIETVDRSCSLNDICDHFFYDGGLLLDPVKRGSGAAVSITNIETPWNSYINSSSAIVGVRATASKQASNPWRNLRSFAGDAPAP
jgi:hypothetical protein